MNAEPNKSKRFNYKLAIILLVSSVAVILLILPMFMGRMGGRGHERSRTISNAKQIGLALFEFEQDYEAYPNNETLKAVTDAFPEHSHDLTGNSSNALFRQLLAAEIAYSEEIFYSKTKSSRKPDGNIALGEALNKGEVGFAYISGLNAKDDPSTPLVLTPLIPGTTKFDPEPFDGTAFVMQIDQNVRTYIIHKDGRIYDKDGIDILSPEHPIWKGKAPTIHYPE